MGVWDNYQRESSNERDNSALIGKRRCVIVGAEERISSAGNPMIVIKVRPSGCNFSVTTWLVKNEKFNHNATQFFDCFKEIPDGDFNLLSWIGAEGAADFGEDEKGYLKVKWWVDAVKAQSLPPFEGEKPERQSITSLADEDDTADDDDLPFM